MDGATENGTKSEPRRGIFPDSPLRMPSPPPSMMQLLEKTAREILDTGPPAEILVRKVDGGFIVQSPLAKGPTVCTSLRAVAAATRRIFADAEKKPGPYSGT